MLQSLKMHSTGWTNMHALEHVGVPRAHLTGVAFYHGDAGEIGERRKYVSGPQFSLEAAPHVIKTLVYPIAVIQTAPQDGSTLDLVLCSLILQSKQ